MKKTTLEKLNGKRNKFLAIALLTAALAVTGCSASDVSSILNQQTSTEASADSANAASGTDDSNNIDSSEKAKSEESETAGSDSADSYMSGNSVSVSSSTLLDTSSMFSDRDLEQEADLSEAEYITLKNGEDVTITSEGVYVLSGSVTDCTVIVEADAAKVQLVLDGVSITNSDSPAIYVKEADKVFITTTDSTNTLKVTGTFTADGDTNTDAVIYSKDDIVLNGVGTLNIESTANGIAGKDDVKVTGGTYNITTTEDAIEAKDSIRICDGSFNITAGKDGLHSENSDDQSLGYIYISGGDITIKATADGIQATTVLMIDGGTIDINAAEGLEGTYDQINGGTLNIYATDDGINASNKTDAYDVVIEINGGEVNIEMASGDTDALDANGDLIVNGGVINITAQFAFDFDNKAEINGGTIYVNGEEVTEITESMTFGPGGNFGGAFGGGTGNFDGQAPSGGTPEGFDGQTPPEGFDGQTPPEGFDGQTPSGNFPGGNGNFNGQAPSGGKNSKTDKSSSN